jgi:hypothetical protein
MNRSSKRFRVAFSFAGERREFVEQVARILARRFGETAILYDKFHEAEFARARLGRYLPRLYNEESDLVVVVICPNYSGKQWCGLEWDAIFDLLKKRREDEVMLANFDRASVEGLYSDAGFVELDAKTPEQFAALIDQRLSINDERAKDRAGDATLNDVFGCTSVPNNLPRLPHFFGREKELSVIADALAPETRTWGALIDGPGGIGKTSLAIRAAEQSTPGQFNRILFLSAKETELTADGTKRLSGFVLPGYLQMLTEIARLLKLQVWTEASETERPRLILEALGQERALLILDNLESVLPEHADQLFILLSRLPHSCKAIVTSRRRTDIDARIVRLDKLGERAALAYIAELANDRPHLQSASEGERHSLYEETGGNRF